MLLERATWIKGLRCNPFLGGVPISKRDAHKEEDFQLKKSHHLDIYTRPNIVPSHTEKCVLHKCCQVNKCHCHCETDKCCHCRESSVERLVHDTPPFSSSEIDCFRIQTSIMSTRGTLVFWPVNCTWKFLNLFQS